MAAITLPSSPGAATAVMRFVSKHNTLRSLVGGTDQVIQRLGSKWSIDVQMPPMPYDVARVWIARLTAGATETVLVPVPQPGMVIGNPGAPVVDGAGQGGMFLNLRGFTPGYEVREGQFFGVVTPGIHGPDRCVYQALTPVTADADGKLRVNFQPMLRRQPANGAVVEMAVPVIDGFVQTAQEWSIDTARHVGLQFSVVERV